MTYAFRAWIDARGSNVDRNHTGYNRHHLRLWDLNRSDTSANIVRVVRRRRPVYLAVYVGAKYRTVLRIGRGR